MLIAVQIYFQDDDDLNDSDKDWSESEKERASVARNSRSQKVQSILRFKPRLANTVCLILFENGSHCLFHHFHEKEIQQIICQTIQGNTLCVGYFLWVDQIQVSVMIQSDIIIWTPLIWKPCYSEAISRDQIQFSNKALFQSDLKVIKHGSVLEWSRNS